MCSIWCPTRVGPWTATLSDKCGWGYESPHFWRQSISSIYRRYLTLSANFQFNVAKCKYMLISRRRHRVPPPVFTISNLQLEEVESFKYLGLLFTTDLSWTTHITSICAKAKQILAMLYRQFYQQSQSGTLLKLYTSLVRPHLEYAWNPYKSKDITMLESVQKFGCKVCTKQWDTGYDQLLQLLDLPTLARRRLYLDLSTMYKIACSWFSLFPT